MDPNGPFNVLKYAFGLQYSATKPDGTALSAVKFSNRTFSGQRGDDPQTVQYQGQVPTTAAWAPLWSLSPQWNYLQYYPQYGNGTSAYQYDMH